MTVHSNVVASDNVIFSFIQVQDMFDVEYFIGAYKVGS